MESHTSAALMLRIISREFSRNGEQPVSIPELLHQVYLKELRGKGLAVYDFSYARRNQVSSDGMKSDLAALSAAGLIEVEGGNPHVTLTSRGVEVAKGIELPPRIEEIVTGAHVETNDEKSRNLRDRVSGFLEYLSYT
jgi:hypothetical protein